MGIIIRSDRSVESGMFPLPIIVELKCDAASGVFCRGFASFRLNAGYIGAHAMAMQAGWLERNSSRGRLWLCPMCSGKG